MLQNSPNQIVSTTAVAERLAVTPPTVTHMVKRLAALELVEHQPYKGVILSECGKKIALKLIRYHRLVECFLVEKLGVPWDQVHTEAEKWEHVLSKELADRMDVILGYPDTDPYGAPIPTQNGYLPQLNYTQLTNLKPDQPAQVAKVTDDDPALLRYLGKLGLYPGVWVSVVHVAHVDHFLTIRVKKMEYGISRHVTNHVFVIQQNTSENDID